MQPNNAHAFFGRGFAYKNLKEYENAASDFEKAKEKYRGILFEKVFKRQFKAWLDLKREESTIKLN